MSTNLNTSTPARNAALNAIAVLGNAGFLRIYDGAQPANADTAVTTQNKLVELPMSATAFGTSSAGMISANPITSAAAIATGTATWYRLVGSDGVSVLWDGDVDTAAADLILSSVSIQMNATVSISSLTYTLPQ